MTYVIETKQNKKHWHTIWWRDCIFIAMEGGLPRDYCAELFVGSNEPCLEHICSNSFPSEIIAHVSD